MLYAEHCAVVGILIDRLQVDYLLVMLVCWHLEYSVLCVERVNTRSDILDGRMRSPHKNTQKKSFQNRRITRSRIDDWIPMR